MSLPLSNLAFQSMSSSNNDDIPSHCFLRVSIAGGPPQTVEIKLYKEQVPIACRNFANLCSASGTTSKTRPLPTYRGSEFHRIVGTFMCQGGDFEKFDGTGGYSSFGGTFADEGFVISHDCPGVVSMANRGKDTNGSQFFITLEACPHLNQKHVAFGQVTEGMNVIHEMTSVELEGTRPVPMQRIVIVDCGKGRECLEESESSTADSSTQKRKKKKEKKRKKHRSKQRKRERRRSDDGSSSSLCEESRRRRKRGHKRRKRHYSSGSDEYYTDRSRKSKDKHGRRERSSS